jgi:hypothetical protein
MNSQFPSPVTETSFRDQAAALGTRTPHDPLRPFEAMFEPLRSYTAARRRAVQCAHQDQANEAGAGQPAAEGLAGALPGFADAVRVLAAQAESLRPLITPAFDDVLALAADERHPLRALLSQGSRAFGFSSQEAGWLFDELAAVQFRPVALVCADGFEDLQALLAAISVGESGLLVAGFVRFTGDPATDERLEKLVLRLRDRSVTPSLFLALMIVLAAQTVAGQQSAH